jgi:hypothetical protein
MHHYNQHQPQPYRNGVRIASPPRQPNYHVRPPNLVNGMQTINPAQVYHPQHLGNVPVQVPQMHHQQHSPHNNAMNSPQMIPQQPPNTNSPPQLQQDAYPPLTGGYYSS